MIRLKIILFVGFVSLIFTKCKSDRLCGNIASNTYGAICSCGKNSFEIYGHNPFVCISDTNCQLEPYGM